MKKRIISFALSLSVVVPFTAPVWAYAQSSNDGVFSTSRRNANSQNPLSYHDIKNRIIPELMKLPSVRGVQEDSNSPNYITIVAVGNINVNLESLRTRLNTNGTDREQEFTKFYKAIRTNISKADPFKPENFRLVVRSKPSLDEFEYLTAVNNSPNYILRKPFVGNIEIAVVADTQSSIAMMPRGRLDDLKLNENDVFDRGLKNLEDFAKKINVKDEGNIYHAKLGDGYDSSIILLDDVLKQFEEKMGGKIAVAIPSRDTFVFVPLNDDAKLASLREYLNNYPKDDYAISRDVFVRTDNIWHILP